MVVSFPLRVLVAHNRYQLAGGEDEVVAREMAMLRNRGHDVELFAADNTATVDLAGQAYVALHSFYSQPARRLAEQKLASFRPDILHVHNFMPTLSPSVFYAAHNARVPVLQTLHNYRLICANGQLFRDGGSCEECLEKRSFLPGVEHACYRKSRIGSFVVGASMAVHSLAGTWTERVDRFIALTAFSAGKLSQTRVPKDKIRIKQNFIKDPGVGRGDGGYALFAGRWSAEKGVLTLLAADAADALPCPVHVVGEGPLAELVYASAARSGSKLVPLGRRGNSDVIKIMQNASALLFPSLWYEGCPLVLIEAMACGLPVIGSDIGGIPELVDDGVSGVLFKTGDYAAMSTALRDLLADPERLDSMRVAARRRYKQDYTEETNYEILIGIYEEMLELRDRAHLHPALSSSAAGNGRP